MLRMTEEERKAYEWAKKQEFNSVAATYARALAAYITKATEANVRADAAIERLRGFANAVIGGWPDDICLDGIELQEIAVKHGLLALKDPRPTAPCSESCNCVEYHGLDPSAWARGVDCYVKTEFLSQALAS